MAIASNLISNTDIILEANKKDLENIINSFKKEYNQEVPIYSAVKINGKKLYEYAREGKEVTFDKVLAVADGDNVTVGTPVVAGAKVTAKVTKQGKAKKIYVFKMKRKKNERKKKGHRQPFTKVTIESINA